MQTNGRLVALLIAFALSQTLTMAQSDTTPPTLVALSFSAATVDVSAATQNLTVKATISDDLSGFSSGYIQFTSPSGQIACSALNGSFFTRISGTDLNGMYLLTCPIPQFSEPGVWNASVSLADNAGNRITLQSATLISEGFPGTLAVVDLNADTTPPTLISAAFAPASIDTSAGPQAITVSLQITDSQSGVVLSNSLTPLVANLSRGSGATADLELWASNFKLVKGTSQNGVWQATLTMPQYSDGSWTFDQVTLGDAAGNRITLTPAQLIAMGINPVLTDLSVPSDTTAPTLTGLSFSPPVIDTSSAIQNVTVSISASDNISGVYFGLFNSTYLYLDVQFQSPSGNQIVWASVNYSQPAPIAGTSLAGTWQAIAQWPQFSEEGTWNVTYLHLVDTVGNGVTYSSAQLQALGFPTTIVVTKPSLAPDGALGAAGGTVDDNSFGARASVTFPAGLVSTSTTISIDVFPSPLSVPTPRGFTMPGTYFENLSFAPALPEPIPAPGITIVLPLLTPMNPGAVLSLYHIDPVLGQLTPAMNAFGNPVMGTVNADGVSATFNNVVTFSTVVAYLSTGSKLGDVNGDGKVNCADVSIVKGSFGKRTGQAGFNSAADLNNDGTVNILDLFIVTRQLPAKLVCQ